MCWMAHVSLSSCEEGDLQYVLIMALLHVAFQSAKTHRLFPTTLPFLLIAWIVCRDGERAGGSLNTGKR